MLPATCGWLSAFARKPWKHAERPRRWGEPDTLDSQIRPVTRICESPRKARLRTIAALRGEVCLADKAAIRCGRKRPGNAAACSVVESGKWTFALNASDDLRCHLFDFGMNNDSLLLHPIFAQMCRAYIIKGRNAKLPQGADQFQM